MSQGSLGLRGEPALDCTTHWGGRQEPSGPCSVSALPQHLLLGGSQLAPCQGLPACLPALRPGRFQVTSKWVGHAKDLNRTAFPCWTLLPPPATGGLAKCFMQIPRPSPGGPPASHQCASVCVLRHARPHSRLCTPLQEHLC